MSVYEILITGILLLGGLRSAWVLPRIWRNELGWDPDRSPAFWGFDLASWRGLVRCSFLAGPMFLAAAPGYALDSAGADGAWAEILVVLSAAVTVPILFVVMPCVFLFNRPRWAVVPHLRHQHGAIAEWRGKRSASTPEPARTPGLRLR